VKHLAQFIGGPMHGLRAVVEGRYYRVHALFGKRDVRVVVYELEEWLSYGPCLQNHKHSPHACYPYTKRNTKTWYFCIDPALDARVARYTAQIFCGNQIWEIRP